MVTVEVLTGDTRAVASTVRSLGGVVTGTVPGEVVQAQLPAAAVEALAGTSQAGFVQLPQRVNRLDPLPEVHGFGALVGQQVDIMNATAWHEAGHYGVGVRVGIVDYFDMSAWNPGEHDVAPSIANGRMFCRDSTAGLFGPSLCNPDGSIDSLQGDVHGVAVAEIVKDVAPGAELYIATAGSVSDLVAAMDWFAANGVRIVTRSLGSPYDGPGDGTGPLAAVVEHAAGKGIVWFNSAGNDADGHYLRVEVPPTLPPGSYVDLDPGPAVDTFLRVDGFPNFFGCVLLDGIRWSTDWYRPPGQRSNYLVEVWEVVNGTLRQTTSLPYFPDATTTPPTPLRGANNGWCPSPGNNTNVTYLRIRLSPSTLVGNPFDTIEIATAFGTLGRSNVAGSAAKPVVDSASPSLVAVGAVHPTPGNEIAVYSSQGPTNDSRIKPDMSATACVHSTIYQADPYNYPCFAGTSASSPAAAGMAALLLSQGLATPGPALAALTKHLVVDLGQPGPDPAFGTGRAQLPDPPAAVASGASAYVPLAEPQRVLVTSTEPPFAPAARYSLSELGLNGVVPADATAIAVTLTSVTPQANGFVQMLPRLRAELGGSASLSVVSGQTRSNMVIVPIGEDRNVSLYRQAGGHLVIDLLGWFTPVAAPVSAGRLVTVEPVRVLDTRPDQPGPVPTGWSPHRPAPGETVRVEIPASVGLPAGQVAALVVNVTATDAQAQGWLRAHPTGSNVDTATLVYRPGPSVASHAIVPLGADGTISIRTHVSTHIVVDLEGYITNADAPAGSSGLFVPLSPARAYDSRVTGGVHPAGTTRAVQIGGPGLVGVPLGATAVSLNLTSTQAAGNGFVTLHAGGTARPTSSNLNFGATVPVANAGIVEVSPGGAIEVFVHNTTHVIIDVNGYFTGAP